MTRSNSVKREELPVDTESALRELIDIVNPLIKEVKLYREADDFALSRADQALITCEKLRSEVLELITSIKNLIAVKTNHG